MDTVVLIVSSSTLALCAWVLRELVQIGRDLAGYNERLHALDRRLTRIEDRIERG